MTFHHVLPHLPDSARIWLFGAHRLMLDREIQSLESDMSQFVAGWQAHGKDLLADFSLLERSILLVAVDETKEPPSGCSIDKVFHLLKTQQEKNELDFFQRTLIWAVVDGDLCIHSQASLLDALRQQTISFETPVVNMLSASLGDFRQGGLLPLSQSWVAKKLQRELQNP